MRFHGGISPLKHPINVTAEPVLIQLPSFSDARGTLIAAEAGDSLPFSAARCFLVRDVPAGAVRARHAQRRGHELLSCVTGVCTVAARWRTGSAMHRLAGPTTALYVPPLVWIECREFSEDAVLMVLCSHPYDPLDQITDLDELLPERSL
jgi:UDP-2-acetamido-3-amino-2,3-dideoxy-glucuronate N-acetyltransferase